MKNTLDSSIVKLTNYRSVWGYIHKNKQATIPQIAKKHRAEPADRDASY